MTPGARILVIDDDPAIRRSITSELRGAGYQTVEATDGRDALSVVPRARPDLIVTDLAMPLMDGFSLITAVRKSERTPIIVLSVRGGESDRVRALDLGADDFVAKPFSTAELLARVRAQLRRSGMGTVARMRFPGLLLDFDRRRVIQGEREIRLTPTEFALLTLLAMNAGKVCHHRADHRARLEGHADDHRGHGARAYGGAAQEDRARSGDSSVHCHRALGWLPVHRRTDRGVTCAPTRRRQTKGSNRAATHFSVKGMEPPQVVHRLLEKKIIATTSPYRVSYARVAAGLPNTPAEVETTLRAIRSLAAH